MTFRVGQGLDVHRFDDGRPLVLGGTTISDHGGLEGHSDGDAVLHAITDALLGSVAAGDIGEYFPSSDDRWLGKDSAVFLEEAMDQVRRARGKVVNIDVTIIAERPRISTHKAAMKKRIGEILDLDEKVINIKATTTDTLGFTGRGEGLAAMAIVLVEIGI